jgi:protein-tyrosine phosphatase
MIDLHTHLLPDWDDGARDWVEMYKMAKVALKDGVTKIVLTPHIFRLTKHGDNPELLSAMFDLFKEKAARFEITFYRGAEVFIHPEIIENIRKLQLFIEGTDYVFVEFPADHVVSGVRDLFYKMMLEGLIPIISHPERNAVFAARPELLFDLINMGALAQVTAKSILGDFGAETRDVAKVFLENNLVHVIASDAHDSEKRPPLLSEAVEKATKIVGKEKAEAMVNSIPQAILENTEIPDFGGPIAPSQKKRWIIRLKR